MALIQSTSTSLTDGRDPIFEPTEPIDGTAPKLTVTEPAPNTQVSATTITVRGTASDPIAPGEKASGVQVVEYRKPDGSYAAATAGATGWSTWSASVPLPTVVPSGQLQYTVTVRCFDRAGNASEVSVPILLKDATAPTVAITAPAPGYVITDTSFMVEGNASDAASGMVQSGVQRVEVLVNNVKAADAALTSSGQGVTWSARVTVPFAVPASGAHTLVARCIDGAGSVAQHSVSFPAKDVTAPSLEILSPLRGAEVAGDTNGAMVPFRGTVSDTLNGTKLSTGVAKVQCLVGVSTFNAQLKPAVAGVHEWVAADVKLPSLGTHTVRVVWADTAGNTDLRDLSIAVVKRSKGEMSRSAYLADLLDYVGRTLRRDEAGTPVDRQLLTSTFLQPFDVTPEPVHLLRIVIEVLRRYRTAQPAAGEADYRFAAYQHLLKQLGSSFEEIRLVRAADDNTREALAARLGVPFTRGAPRPDTLDALFLEPDAITEEALEQRFGLLSTQRNPLDLVKDSLLLTRRNAQVIADWQEADKAAPKPIVDPDLIGTLDLKAAIAGNRAYDLWKARQQWAANELARLRTLRQSDATALGGMNKLIADIWDAAKYPTPEPYPNLDAVEADRKAGKSIEKQLDLLKLDVAAFLYLQRIRKLAAATNATVVKSEWEDVYAILLQVQKRRLYPAWKEAERQKNLALSAEYFVLPAAVDEQALRLSAWRATATARQEWQDTLRSRIGQQESVAQALRQAVDATEEATLPLLRDALVAAIGNDPTLSDRLTRRLLIDVRDSGFRMTTRVEQAIATLQEVLFSLRAGRSKEPDALLGKHPAAAWGLKKTEEQFDQEWRWMGSYESWRAATFVYHFPENLVLPTLRERSRMSDAFAAFLQAVRGENRLTPAAARTLAASYLNDLFAGFGLVARWTFDEGKGTAVADATGRGNVAAFPPSGALPVWVNGHHGAGLSFDGASYIRMENAPSVELGTNGADFAVTFWLYLKKGATGAWRIILQKGNSDAERAPAIFLHPTSNRLHFRISTAVNANDGGDSVKEVAVNRWTHVGCVKSGSKLQLYLDGTLDAEVMLGGAAKSSAGPLYLGKTPWHAGTAAVIDDLCIYNPAALGMPGTAMPLELRHPAILTDQLTDEGFTKRRDISSRLMAPYKDGTSSALKPEAPGYLEEVFYFVPMQLALQLQKSGQHLAALDWFQTVYAYNLPLAQRKIHAALDYEKAVTSVYAASSDIWLATGLNPHAIAAKRANAYTRFTLMSLIRCFIEFADAEFTRDTAESVPRARSLYLSALELLDLPEMQPSIIGEGPTAVKLVNPALTALRAHAELNLHKLRQGRNITGMQRRSEPEPEQPVAAPTIGAGGQLVVSRPVALRPTPYYYAVLVERAKQLVTIAQQMEAAYLAALEKRDAEAYSLLRARQDVGLTQATVDLQSLRVSEAAHGVRLAEEQKARTQIEVDRYSEWLATPQSELEKSVIEAYKDANLARNNLAGVEYLITSAQSMIHAAGVTNPVAAPLAFASVVVATAGAFARAGLQATINNAETTAQVNSILASQERRYQEWELHHELAQQDLLVGTQQKLIADSRQAIAEKEKSIAQMQADNARTVVDFLANKFTSVEMYEWMSGVLGSVYSYFLQQATAVAQLAGDQLAFERQEPPPAFIQSDYWQAPEAGQSAASADGKAPDRRGLTGSARLLQDIYQLDQYAFESNKRKLQLAQTFSLAALAAFEFQRFREDGRLPFETPMELFDRAFPGHYLRLIRRVRMSVIALVPPAQGIRATLTSSGVSRVVIGGSAFQTVPIHRDPEIVALSSPTNATGLFEMDIQSDMLLPFEGTGVATRWELLMPKAANPFDYRSIADVLFTIEYTALNSFVLRNQLIQALPSTVSADRAISIRRQSPDQWYALHNPAQSAEPMTVRFSLAAKDFPPNLSADTLRLQELVLAVARADGAAEELAVRRIKAPKGSVEVELTTSDGVISTRRPNGSAWKSALAASNPTGLVGDWELALRDDAATRALFATGAISDLLLVVTYRGEGPAWV